MHLKYCNRRVIFKIDSKINEQYKSPKPKKSKQTVSKFSSSYKSNDTSVENNKFISDLPPGTLMISKIKIDHFFSDNLGIENLLQ